MLSFQAWFLMFMLMLGESEVTQTHVIHSERYELQSVTLIQEIIVNRVIPLSRRWYRNVKGTLLMVSEISKRKIFTEYAKCNDLAMCSKMCNIISEWYRNAQGKRYLIQFDRHTFSDLTGKYLSTIAIDFVVLSGIFGNNMFNIKLLITNYHVFNTFAVH